MFYVFSRRVPRNEATTTSMTPKSMRLQSVGQLPSCNPQLWYPHPHKESFLYHQTLGWSSAPSHPVVVNVPSAQRNLLDELQGIDMTASAFPQPPQQALQLQGATGLSGLVASAAQAQADKHAQPPELISFVGSGCWQGRVGRHGQHLLQGFLSLATAGG